MYKYGYFNEDGNEFVITNPETPRAFDNFIWNDSVFSNINQTGIGYMDYQIGNTEAVQLLTGVGRICDFDVYGRDHLMSRLIYIKDLETQQYFNVNWEPVKKQYEDFKCIHGMGYSIISNTTDRISSSMRIFSPVGEDPVEIWTITLKNLKKTSRKISIFVYNQFQFKYKSGFDSYGDMIFRGTWFSKDKNAIIASKHPHICPHDYLTGFMSADIPVTGYDGSRDAFVGRYNTLKEPTAVIQGNCTGTSGSSDATIGALQFNLELLPEGITSFNLILGVVNREEEIVDYKKKYSSENIEKEFFKLKNIQRDKLFKNRIQTPDEHFNRMSNYWIKRATDFGSSWCRWGWFGYRDIVQHGLGVVSFMPQRTRKILIDAFGYQYSSGLALRGWNPVDEKSYSDSALWLVFTLTAYIKETGDVDLLEKVIPYYDNGSGTVLEHIKQALNFLENNKGAHGLCLIKFGDWNDSLTGVGKEGRGESVWLSMTYGEALKCMAELSDFIKDAVSSEDYKLRYERIKGAVNDNAWDGKWYLRCFDDNSRPIGSSKNSEGRIYTNAQSWAMISGIVSEDRMGELLKSCDEMLLTDYGYQLLSPTYVTRDNNIGRISYLEPGVCENGTIYTHVNIWMILALLRQNLPNKAYDIFRKITPGYSITKEDKKQDNPPYIYANCYYGKDHRNNAFQMEFTWITGSVAWFNHVILNEMLGAKADYEGLRIAPCLPAEWDRVEIVREYRGSNYKIIIRNPEHIIHGTPRIIVDGKKLVGNLIKSISDGKLHEVDVLICNNLK